jgi:prepilin-type N-terminal cleavage/methylation domain-containing protein
MKRVKAFTLIEVLVVIAITSILAAIIFPVFARAKDSSNRNSDLSSMNSLRTALQLYKVDQGGFPPAILGYATLYTSGPQAGSIIPADRLTGFLYPKRIDSIQTLTPVYNRAGRADVVSAVWPTQDNRAVGQAPVYDINGDGQVSGADDTVGARQRFGTATTVGADRSQAADAVNLPAQFYKVSGYDVAEVPATANSKRVELRYSLFWSDLGLGAGSALDDPRQLGYGDPPDSTVITWNSYFRDIDPSTGAVKRDRRDLVLFLGGNAKGYDSKDLADRSWRVTPR